MGGKIMVHLLVELPEQHGKVHGVDAHQGQTEIEQGIEVLFDDDAHGIVKDPSALVEVAGHLLLKAGFHLIKLGSQLFDVFVEVPGFGAVAEVNGVKRIKFHKAKGKLNAAIAGELFEFVRHTEKAGTSIKGEAILFQLVQPASGLAVLFHDFHTIPRFGQTKGRGQTSQSCTRYHNMFLHTVNYNLMHSRSIP